MNHQSIDIKEVSGVQDIISNSKSKLLLGKVIASAVNTVLAPKSTTGVIDRGTHLEVGGWKVSKDCLGEPTLPKGEIEINEQANKKKPQAWSYLIDKNTISHDEKYHGFELWKRIFPWFENMSMNEAEAQGLFPVTIWEYNYEGAKKEIEYRGQYLPSQVELLRMINSVSGNCIEKAKALRLPFAGYCRAGYSELTLAGFTMLLWTSLSGGVCLHRGNDRADAGRKYHGHGALVRSFLDNKRI